MIHKISKELRILRKNVKSLLNDLTGYLRFRDSVQNTFDKVLAQLKTLNAAL